jgi:hypothetical protein
MLSVLILPKAAVPAPRNDPVMPHSAATIQQNARAADSVVIGKVLSIGPPPPAWSGMFAAWQQVDYRVLDWLKKPETRDLPQRISAYHLVVSGAPTADPAAPRLRASIFHPGAELILFLREAGSRYEVFDEYLGVLPNEPTMLQRVEAVLRAAAQEPSGR